MIISQSANVLQQSFSDLWYAVVQFIPSILAAIIIFIIGWIVGVVLYRVVDQVVKILRVDDALKAAGLNEMAREAGFNLNVGAFLGTLVQWFTVIVFLVAALDVLGLNQVTIFLQQVVLLYLPQVIVAVLILILAAIVAETVRNIVASSARAAGAKTGELAGSVAKWAIWVFAIMAILNQLGIATEFVQTLFTGLVVAISLAFGLAFGLGGKEAAARAIEKVRSEVAHGRG
ncbi:hypothetical protein C4556_03020 [Candidatus Parcubacteria bacterium]|nr:MAG: hypothetical protein C4556_03020 [Candidatus Parcubacteria bacterium]